MIALAQPRASSDSLNHTGRDRHSYQQVSLPGSFVGAEGSCTAKSDPAADRLAQLLLDVPAPPREDWLVPAEPFEAALDCKLGQPQRAPADGAGLAEPTSRIGEAANFPSLKHAPDLAAAKRPHAVNLEATLGPGFTRLSSESLMAINLVVFVRKPLLASISDVRTSVVATGVGNMLGNKGGAAIGFTYQNTKLLFISSHFAAHEHKVAQRNSDFHRIKSNLFSKRAGMPGLDGSQHSSRTPGSLLPQPRFGSLTMVERVSSVTSDNSSLTGSDSSFSAAGGADSPQTPSRGGGLRAQVASWGRSVTDEFDVTVWVGDFNYRVEGNRRVVDLAMRERMWEVLRHNDQLRREKAKGRVFKGFEEGVLDFPPTYKFDPNTDTYDTSAKMRTPSWTDRILWKCNPHTWPNGVHLLHYSHVSDVKLSDHRPVAAVLEVNTRSHLEEPAERPSLLIQSLRRMQTLRCTIQ
ncbi:hypothetical protein WJX72_012152 [[Myrmecia] bisecta]|uniref:Inositol polyphosphate-related phosphatase domain-containing protein n=1 Tax=[Myrmecia] bisecta TaxID=41462 RepID=A0AAW1QGM4_9CHLO